MLDFFISQAWAQEGSQQATQSPFQALIPFILIFVVFYFLMIRPQKKRMQEEQAFLNALEKGQEVYTKSGLIGTVEGMADKVVTLKLADNVKVKILKGQIAGPSSKIFEKKGEQKKAQAAVSSHSPHS